MYNFYFKFQNVTERVKVAGTFTLRATKWKPSTTAINGRS
jgi:hypothetical protein